MECAATSSSEVPILWGVCALPGTHGTSNRWGSCKAHAPCTCAGVQNPHLRFHPECVHFDASRQRSHVWPSLTSGIPDGNVTWSERPGDMAWFFGVPSRVDVCGQEVAMHVRKISKASVPCSPASCNPASTSNLASLPTHACQRLW